MYISDMNLVDPISSGRDWARTRWNSHETGASFDRKKNRYLTPEAKAFVKRQEFCVVSLADDDDQVCGRLLYGRLTDFTEALDDRHLIVRSLNGLSADLLSSKARGRGQRLAVIFIEFKTRQRLCVHGISKWEDAGRCLRLEVTQSFFHCPKYIDPNCRLVHTVSASARAFKAHKLAAIGDRELVIDHLADFLAYQRVAFLCTVDRNGQCAVNHRGGPRGFLSLSRIDVEPWILLPDYAGNGAFEAVGNIWETERAAVFVPDLELGCGICVFGSAKVLDGDALRPKPSLASDGAKRIVAIYASYCRFQSWEYDLAKQGFEQQLEIDAAAGTKD
jgi:uncharacterized protein